MPSGDTNHPDSTEKPLHSGPSPPTNIAPADISHVSGENDFLGIDVA